MLRELLTTGDATDPATCTGSICRILDPPAGSPADPLANLVSSATHDHRPSTSAPELAR
jgi:hypothetical protein